MKLSWNWFGHWAAIVGLACGVQGALVLCRPKADDLDRLTKPLEIEVRSVYKLYPEDGVRIMEIKNVGVTYYTRGEATVPGVIMRSGRHVYVGAAAVSRDLWAKSVAPGDLVYVKKLKRWLKVEDTMGPGYVNRVDVYSDNMAEAKSGSFRTDIIIVRPRAD